MGLDTPARSCFGNVQLHLIVANGVCVCVGGGCWRVCVCGGRSSACYFPLPHGTGPGTAPFAVLFKGGSITTRPCVSVHHIKAHTPRTGSCAVAALVDAPGRHSPPASVLGNGRGVAAHCALPACMHDRPPVARFQCACCPNLPRTASSPRPPCSGCSRDPNLDEYTMDFFQNSTSCNFDMYQVCAQVATCGCAAPSPPATAA